MFAVFIPTFWAGSIHGWWGGMIVFVLMTCAVIWINIHWMYYLSKTLDSDKVDDTEEKSVEELFSPAQKRRTWLATIACILIAISGIEFCSLDKNGVSHCRSPWRHMEHNP